MKTAVILSAALGLIATPVLAVTSGAHFISADGTVGSTGSLTVNFEEAGLGNGSGSVHVVMTGSVRAMYACINGGSNHPKASNKEDKTGTFEVPGDFTIGKNGRATGTLTALAPGAGDFTCPSGQALQMACVRYSNVVLTDTTNTNQPSIDVDGLLFRTFNNLSRICDI